MLSETIYEHLKEAGHTLTEPGYTTFGRYYFHLLLTPPTKHNLAAWAQLIINEGLLSLQVKIYPTEKYPDLREHTLDLTHPNSIQDLHTILRSPT